MKLKTPPILNSNHDGSLLFGGSTSRIPEDAVALQDFRVALFSDPPMVAWILPELLRSGLNVACVVSVTPRLLQNDGLDQVAEMAQKEGVPFFRPETLQSEKFVTDFFETKPSIIATATLSKRIPKSILDRVPQGGINFHPSLLPSYRGACPYFWPIVNGERQTGVTIHEMVEAFDAGDIHFRRKIPIDPAETSGSLAMKCARSGIKLLILALRELKEGRKLPRISQDLTRVSRARYPTPADLEISWDTKAEKILALVRAGSPYYGAFAVFRNKRLVIWSAQISRPNSEKVAPGTLVISKGKTEVAARDHFVSLETILDGLVQYYSGQEFLRIPGIRDGEQFGQ